MSAACHRCGPVRHEAPTVLCAPCTLFEASEQEARAIAAELLAGRVVFTRLRNILTQFARAEIVSRRVAELVNAGYGA